MEREEAGPRGWQARLRHSVQPPWSPRAVVVGLFAAVVVYASGYLAAVTRYPDSVTYADVDFFGGAGRLWVVPTLYELVGSGRGAALVQAAIAALCWGVLAWSVSARMRTTTGAWLALLVLLALGLTPQVLQWNSIIQSESLTISLTVLLFAVWLRLMAAPSTKRLAVVLAVAFVWAFTRHLHVAVLPALVVAMLLCALGNAPRRRLFFAGAGVLLLIGIAGGVTVAQPGADELRKLDAQGIVAARVLPRPEVKAYFEARGLPTRGVQGSGNIDQDLALVQQDPHLTSWLERNWTGAYMRFLLSHPGNLFEPVEEMFEVLAEDPQHGPVSRVQPEPVSELLFSRQRGDLVLLGVALLAVLLCSHRRRRLTTTELIGVAAVAFGVGWYWVMWLYSYADFGRLGLPMGVLIRVGLLTALLVGIEGLLRPERATASAD